MSQLSSLHVFILSKMLRYLSFSIGILEKLKRNTVKTQITWGLVWLFMGSQTSPYRTMNLLQKLILARICHIPERQGFYNVLGI